MPYDFSATGSTVLLDEYFASEDPGFLDELRRVTSLLKLAGLADRWKTDPRPWARQQIFDYLELPLNSPGHHSLVKRLFKHAEETRDHELMASFMIAFDRSLRRVRRTRFNFDSETRELTETQFLAMPRDSIPARLEVIRKLPGTGERMTFVRRIRPDYRLFSHHTRQYMRRRAWRYFRRLGFQEPGVYVQTVARALGRYRDEDFAKPEHMLDNWGLMHACFRNHGALTFRASAIGVAKGRSLSELTAAPKFPHAWSAPGSAEVLLSLVTEASSRLVRVWAMDLIRGEHWERLRGIDLTRLLGFLNHQDPEVRGFGVEILQACRTLDAAPVELWMRLLDNANPDVLTVVCDLMRTRVAPETITLDELLGLACSASTPVAEMALQFLRHRPICTAEERAGLARLAQAKCHAKAGEITEFALSFLGTPETYDRDAVSEFLDSLLPETRQSAWTWLTASSPGLDDPLLWCRLTETPFDDVRLSLVTYLSDRTKTVPKTVTAELTAVWSSILLGVHRGGRGKPAALRRIAAHIEMNPASADSLLPVLCVAARSIREPERRAGLAAVVGLTRHGPELADKVRRSLPELEL
ncbi:MAG: hypothetical protein AB1646_14230 [Thermodesulfobacteriota bacterium]